MIYTTRYDTGLWTAAAFGYEVRCWGEKTREAVALVLIFCDEIHGCASVCI